MAKEFPLIGRYSKSSYSEALGIGKETGPW